jgi:FkbM family methyltransferase
MNNQLKTYIQKILNFLGWKMSRYVPQGNLLLAEELRVRNICFVLDIGANAGQFGSALFAAGYSGSLVSFEPLPGPYQSLLNLAGKNTHWTVAPRSAVGSANGEITINVSQNSVSSSILPILEQHQNAAPRSAYVASEVVPIITLDVWLSQNPAERPFIKIDTQGYEMEVLKGAESTLRLASGIKVEVSIAPLYEGQPDYLSLIEFIRSAGFSLWSIEPGFSDPITGRLLQFDAVFFRE